MGYCIPKEKIEKLKSTFQKISNKGQLDKLINMSSKKREVLFKKVLTKDEAKLLNKELERVVATERANNLVKFVKDNLDKNYRQKKITQKQRASISNFINRKLQKSGKRRIEITPIKDVLKMPVKEQKKLLKKTFGDKYTKELQADFNKAKKITKNKISEAEKQIDKTKKSIDNYIQNKAKKKGKSTTLTATKILKMSNDERTDALVKMFGDAEAKKINNELLQAEKIKLLAKKENLQKQVFNNFIKKKKKQIQRVSKPISEILEMNDDEQLKFLKTILPDNEAKTIQHEIQMANKSIAEKQIDRALKNYTNLDDFDKEIDNIVDNVVSKKERVKLNDVEVEKITELAQNISNTKEIWLKDKGNKAKREDYGLAILEMKDLTDDLAYETNKIEVAKKLVLSALSLNKVLMATGEFSFMGIQLMQTMFRKQWWELIGVTDLVKATKGKGLKAFTDSNAKNVWRFASKKYYNRFQADIITRENVKMYRDSGLRVMGESKTSLTAKEDMFIGNYILDKFGELIENVPVASPAYKFIKKIFIDAPSDMFTGAVEQLRADQFDIAVNASKVAKNNLTKKDLQSLARTINGFSGSSDFGRLENSVPYLATTFWSPRLIKSKIDIVRSIKPAIIGATKAGASKTLKPNEAEALRSLRSLALASVSMYGLAKMYQKYSGRDDVDVELNPKSSDFGKVRIGKHRINFLGNNSSYATLVARMITGETKSTSTGTIYKIGEGFSKSKFDYFADFLRAKLNPLVGSTIDVMEGEDFLGRKTGLTKEISNSIYPITYADIYDLYKSDDLSVGEATGISALSMFGFSSATYKGRDWEDSVEDSKKKKQFKEFIGDEKFKEANEKYNKRLEEKHNNMRHSETFRNLPLEQQQKDIASVSRILMSEIFKEYGFTYKKETKTKAEKQRDNLRVQNY